MHKQKYEDTTPEEQLFMDAVELYNSIYRMVLLPTMGEEVSKDDKKQLIDNTVHSFIHDYVQNNPRFAELLAKRMYEFHDIEVHDSGTKASPDKE